ncbi:6,7-dimethyl-8-ribityllumazine synthase [bacterium]|nr:6,7-dimethyl-8-ribityllumazine synthase [bacterium]
MANRILKKDYADLIFCFGVVIKGETPHFDYVCGECAR